MSGRAAAGIEGQLGALGQEVAALMRPLLAPLVEKWEDVTGDHEQVHDTALRWRAMSRAVSEVARDGRVSAALVVGEWEGVAHDAFDRTVSEVVEDLDELAERTGEVADLLDRAAVAVREAELVVADLVRELVEWAAVSLAVSAVTGLVTLGASAAAGAAAAAAKAGVVGARIAARLQHLAVELRRIERLLDAYQSWVKSLGRGRKQLARAAERAAVKVVTPLDADVRRPTLQLVAIRAEQEGLAEPGPGDRRALSPG
ncbi:WXG100 family type VII secretion target [Nocardioides piscis]|uniref:WXG100 family type VII secretion target n=1 Tax=Nocardioides piscis TaxID=2714938 RepID=A0A6G7YDS6_9ACTN|nr:hypothetical protein [Nocardioides piscis]QIK74972.1 hypothetical protein G7071_05525 [Nocardioides piscis]